MTQPSTKRWSRSPGNPDHHRMQFVTLPSGPTVPVPLRWMHPEPAKTMHGNVAYYWLHCQRCFKPKGRTQRKLCLSCSRSHPRGGLLAVHCPHCQEKLDRNAIIKALYFSDVPSTALAEVFRLSPNQILNIIKDRSSGSRKK